MSRKSRTAVTLARGLDAGNVHSRSRALREVCPCRSNDADIGLWREVFRKAREGSMSERHGAAHAIGTLLRKTAPRWRTVVQTLAPELDAAMADERASRQILGQLKRHGHAHRGAAAQFYRRSRKSLSVRSPEELARFVNAELGLAVTAEHPGVLRLWRWMSHRIGFQPERKTREREVIERARRYISA